MTMKIMRRAMPAVFLCCAACHAPAEGVLTLSPPPVGTQFEFSGFFGHRVEVDVQHWLIPAPVANPGMIEMFHVRDRKPVPELVPWAGEFVGKYLISAIQALRMSRSTILRDTVADVVRQAIAAQDADGYLGPFRKEERLLKYWDLWGHYHLILAMLMWHEETGDEAAFACAKKMGDFVCKVYLNTDKRPIDAGSTEMNLSIIHGLGRLYRATQDEKYLQMMRVVEEDWQKAGDYFRQGLADVPFYKIPSPRWESLHDLQGLGELYRITGNEDYKTAYVNLWKSIRKFDRHNTGGFSTGEQAVGNPYTPGAIETCCTTAWSAITKDVLELTGAPEAADELELSLYNSILGSQHPSGRWFTYNTPMDGKREASAHTIVFQSRAGTPELNCCSVNAPRGLGMVSEWAVLRGADHTLHLNYLGPMTASLPDPDGGTITINTESNYPIDGKIKVSVTRTEARKSTVTVQVRVPSWAHEVVCRQRETEMTLQNDGKSPILLIIGPNKESNELTLDIPLPMHTWLGDGAQLGKVSIYRGPLLLAFDQRDNDYDVADLTPLDYKSLDATPQATGDPFAALLALRFKTLDGKVAVLRDFATAGATGTEYASWIPVTNAPPPGFDLEFPGKAAKLPAGPSRFTWSGNNRPDGWSYILEVADDNKFEHLAYTSEPTRRPAAVLRAPLENGRQYHWRVRAGNPNGETLSEVRSFTVDASLANDFVDNPATYEFRSDGLIVGDYVDGKPAPAYGFVDLATGVSPASDRHGKPEGAIQLDGKGQIRYKTPGMPGDNYTVSVWFRVDTAQQHMAQVFSAWSKFGDDPLRLVIDKGNVYARIEGAGGANTKGTPVTLGKWTHVAAVKAGGNLKFYVDGALIDSVGAPAIVPTLSKDVSLGSNPHHSGDEHLRGAIDDFALWARPLGEAEVKALASGPLKL